MVAKTSAKKPRPTRKSGVKKTAVQKKVVAKKTPKKKTTQKKSVAKPKAPIRQRANFRLNEYVVYPSHGVGQIVEISEQIIAEHLLEFFIVNFAQERLVLKIPVKKVVSVGMRKISDEKTIGAALSILKQPAKIKRTMWSRRAQEYESKINSGSLILLCEVVRDLHRGEHQPDQSYSERQLYEGAFSRLAGEIAVVRKLNKEGAVETLLTVLNHPDRFAVRTPQA